MIFLNSVLLHNGNISCLLLTFSAVKQLLYMAGCVFPLISALAGMALRLEVLICDQMDYYHFRSFHAFLSIDVKFLHVFLGKKKDIPELIINSMDTLTQYLCTLI